MHAVYELYYIALIYDLRGVTKGEETTCRSGAPEFTLRSRWGSFCSILTIALSVLRIKASDYPFGILKPFLNVILYYRLDKIYDWLKWLAKGYISHENKH
jgi:hypothetical protein